MNYCIFPTYFQKLATDDFPIPEEDFLLRMEGTDSGESRKKIDDNLKGRIFLKKTFIDTLFAWPFSSPLKSAALARNTIQRQFCFVHANLSSLDGLLLLLLL